MVPYPPIFIRNFLLVFLMAFLWENAGATVRLLPYDVEVTGTNLGNYPLRCVLPKRIVGHIFPS